MRREIVAYFAAAGKGPSSPEEPASCGGKRESSRQNEAGGDENQAEAKGKSFKLTIRGIPHPAYMVNYNFELTRLNDEAQTQLLGGIQELPSNAEARSIFRFLIKDEACACGGGCCEELLRLHLVLARRRMSKLGLAGICKDLPPDKLRLLESLYAEADNVSARAIVECPVRIPGTDGRCQPHYAYTTMFREGVLFVYVPEGPGSGTLLSLLGRRDEVIRHLISPPN